ncbi:hypothetical protein ACFLZL_01930 [Thermodesulfobacteriota bacterium]
MSNREKIILALMAVAVLYGAYSIFFANTPKPKGAGKEKSLEEINRFIADVAVKVEEQSSQKHAYILSQAKNNWVKDPFFKINVPVKEEVVVQATEEEVAPKETFAYTGYLQMGSRIIAIIDGLEYESGDELTKGGHIVKVIDPKRVLIGPQDEDNNIVLFLNETK